MDLDEMKQRWEAQQQRLDASLRLNERLLHGAALAKIGGAMDGLARGLWAEALLNAVAVLWLGSFAADHVAEPRFAVPAAALLAGAIALVVAGVRQLVMLKLVDYGAPVVAIQKQLESLKVQRIRATQWTLILAPLAWPPLFVVGMKGFLGVDAYQAFSVPWLIANVLFGLAVVVVARWISVRYADRMSGSPRLQRWMQTLAGHRLNAAAGYLASLRELERDATT
ncbi:MAG TPA: hypothetical protein VIG99_12970 [Myxococcaceae bacterium]|jgi:hypothetical protein